jgi:RNase P subunit RPR2
MKLSKPKPHEQTHAIINCINCGEPREVRVQDLHQVVRCKECQRIHRLEQRRMLKDRQKNNV